MHGQTCQFVLGFSHSVRMHGRTGPRRKKGHTDFRALMRWNSLFLVGKTKPVAVNLMSLSKWKLAVGIFSYLLDHTVLFHYLHSIHCFLLVVYNVHFMFLKQRARAQLGLILNTSACKHVILELKGSFNLVSSL